MMTREDLLRELELLPRWELRMPMPPRDISPAIAPTSQPAELPSDEEPLPPRELDTVQMMEAPASNASLPVGDVAQSFSHLVSEQGDYLFLLPIAIQLDEMLLMRNILSAMVIKGRPLVEHSLDLSHPELKLVIAMGESVAQTVLQTKQSLNALRGRMHALGHHSLVVTYDLAHLLSHAADKRHCWQDLCMAMQLVAQHSGDP